MFILQLNDMRISNAESLTLVARAETQEKLKRLMTREEGEGYRDGQWAKVFRRGGPLEWYNPPLFGGAQIMNVGSADDWASKARIQFEEQIMGLPLAD